MKQKVIIVGAGFGGISAAKELCDSNCDIVIIDKTNHHLFQPLLYQVATAGLSPADIAMPVRAIFTGYDNVHVIMEEVLSIDTANSSVILQEQSQQYDFLIVATGARHTYFGKDNWETDAPGLKTLNDALLIREKMLYAFEKAEILPDGEEKRSYLTFAIIGGGPTGVEMAGSIAEIAKQILEKDFNNIDPQSVKILLIEAGSRLLPMYSEQQADYTKEVLTQMGVTVLLKAMAEEIDQNSVKISGETVPTKNVIWAAGNAASPLLKCLEIPLDRAGRALVNADLSIPGNENIFVIGDASAVTMNENELVPGVAPAAMQEGRYVGKAIKNRMEGKLSKPFKYVDKGSMATIGRAKAVANIWGLKFTGFFAWLLWSFIHVFFLISYRNRFRVMAEWIWSYLSFRNAVRLITGRKP